MLEAVAAGVMLIVCGFLLVKLRPIWGGTHASYYAFYDRSDGITRAYLRAVVPAVTAMILLSVGVLLGDESGWASGASTACFVGFAIRDRGPR